jgi:uncharacterized membrane protein
MAICLFVFLSLTGIDKIISIMYSWDLFCLSMIILNWIVFFSTTKDHLYQMAKKQDESLPITFLIVLVTVCFSLLGTVFMIINNDINSLVVALLGVGLSWLLLHTIFTIRYDHLFYDLSIRKSGTHYGGLEFPKEDEPDYIDFAYFSFVIGMTFQVSDVSITSRRIRRIALMHGLISFVFNAIIVALTISIIANLK